MQANQILTFGPYRLDVAAEQLWRGKQVVKLTGKAFAVLCALVEQAGRVVTKDALFATVWGETVVSDDALTSCIQELRHALGDAARQPRYIETVHRRGFRFIGKVSHQRSAVSYQQEGVGARTLTLNIQHSTLPIVGREAEVAQLHGYLEKALRGERQIIFVTGEPGIGKTTVVDTFLTQLANDQALWIGRGQCIEHYGAGEAYLPILEALGRLCREPAGQHLIELLSQHAPT